MSTFAEMILTPIWETLTKSTRLYVQAKIMEGGDLKEATDSDGNVLGFDSLVFALFEFVSSLLDSGEFREMVQKGLPDLTYFLILYMQCTEDMRQPCLINPFSSVDRWSDGWRMPSSWVEDEDEEGYSYSAQDLLLSLAEEFEENGAGTALVASLERHLTESQKLRKAGVPSWWKVGRGLKEWKG
ncbi:unnamed protein product [Cyprideis torosa]|uniref:Uncharacterized protein n=1 Tax=Cyprideis torosa TaxID=163714 RepID=A0A7R8WV06_9CRUS|nr:unnamed protein product [Cyprideis torosa]CAG0909891.1 unnamed protein product [Cyprideis torosa]